MKSASLIAKDIMDYAKELDFHNIAILIQQVQKQAWLAGRDAAIKVAQNQTSLAQVREYRVAGEAICAYLTSIPIPKELE